MNATLHAIMVILISCTGQGENRYTKISIRKIQYLLKKIYKIHVKRRWIFYCMAILISKGYITRKPRYLRKERGFIKQISSMIWFTVRGIKYLITRKVIGAKEFLQHMRDGMENTDKRVPKKEIYNDGSWWPMDPEIKAGLKSLLGGLTKEIS